MLPTCRHGPQYRLSKRGKNRLEKDKRQDKTTKPWKGKTANATTANILPRSMDYSELALDSTCKTRLVEAAMPTRLVAHIAHAPLMLAPVASRIAISSYRAKLPSWYSYSTKHWTRHGDLPARMKWPGSTLTRCRVQTRHVSLPCPRGMGLVGSALVAGANSTDISSGSGSVHNNA
ncbi:hypothetical protein M441DRAFT_56119 [Trichoderma asperellum CBS 433.97]|uniref:Uncharacterized protein n=1 Tax=Trichoderma asperellum (strain ATCC 204424 / CBS 433.97 / NBRC 101777) TaxID=1042311 RepID=A0A2T3ZE47_TRIA4|nr:hypothetical protein M441DRAFT_56119 [Trichoderma asperellum CBS 433.97]PTB43086.1 hypothetical protein M441DRAFT_56119 [Trichoderma asperellum CBS 433.97]